MTLPALDHWGRTMKNELLELLSARGLHQVQQAAAWMPIAEDKLTSASRSRPIGSRTLPCMSPSLQSRNSTGGDWRSPLPHHIAVCLSVCL